MAGNSGYQGGGLYNQGSLTVVNSTIAGNATAGTDNGGGGIYNTKAGRPTLVNSTIAYNTVNPSANRLVVLGSTTPAGRRPWTIRSWPGTRSVAG